MITLTEYQCDNSLAGLIENARNELFQHEQSRSEFRCVWGYFPGLEAQEHVLYPHSMELGRYFDPAVKARMGNAMQLSFLKFASKKPDPEFGGLHVDTRISARNEGPNDMRILRLVLNLGTRPRTLKYAPYTADELRERGIVTSKDVYSPVDLPADFETRTIEIPGREPNKVWAAQFWASEIPHVGVTDEHGYFVGSYAGYFSKDSAMPK